MEQSPWSRTVGYSETVEQAWQMIRSPLLANGTDETQGVSMNDVWIINGIPGAGKSTVARALAERLPRAVHLEGDRVQEFIVSGGVPPGGQPAEEEGRQIHLNVRNQCLLARSYADAGFTPVIDYVLVNQQRVEEYRDYLRGLTVHLVTLAPGMETALARDRERPEKTVAANWTHLDTVMRAELQEIGLWIDNSQQTIDETVDHILAHPAARL